MSLHAAGCCIIQEVLIWGCKFTEIKKSDREEALMEYYHPHSVNGRSWSIHTSEWLAQGREGSWSWRYLTSCSFSHWNSHSSFLWVLKRAAFVLQVFFLSKNFVEFFFLFLFFPTLIVQLVLGKWTGRQIKRRCCENVFSLKWECGRSRWKYSPAGI